MLGIDGGYLTKWGGAMKSCEMRFYPDGNFRYIEFYGAQQIEFNVHDVASVTMNQAKMGMSVVKINGNGTALAITKGLPTNWARSLKEWIEGTVAEYLSAQNIPEEKPNIVSDDPFNKLKKLKELKDLQIISEDEYTKKRAELLKLI